jgi:hypothetical protein
MTQLKVWIYKGSRRAETYLYVAEENNFKDVPAELLQAMGKLELVMELDIDEQRKLARVEAKTVIKSVQKMGYFLQMPPVKAAGARKLQ